MDNIGPYRQQIDLEQRDNQNHGQVQNHGQMQNHDQMQNHGQMQNHEDRSTQHYCEIEETFRNIWMIIIVFILVLYLVIDKVVLSDILFKESLKVQVEMQVGISRSTVDYYLFMTKLGNEYLIGIFGLIYLLDHNRKRVFTLLLTLCWVVGTTQFLKMVESQPRPFWVDKRIIGFHCEIGYGHPSGHSSASFYTYISLYYEYVWLIVHKNDTLSIIYKAISGLVAIFIISTVVYSRLILGVHSIDQVLLGSVIGFSFGWMYMVKLKLMLERLLIHLNRTNLQGDQEIDEERKSYIKQIIIIIVIQTIVSILVFYQIYSTQQLTKSWIASISQVCKIAIDQNTKYLAVAYNLKSISILYAPYSLFIAIMLRAKLYDDLCKSSKYRDDQQYYQQPNLFYVVMFRIAELLVSIPVFLFLGQIHGNPYVMFLFKYLPINLIVPLFVLVVGPYLMDKARLGRYLLRVDDLQSGHVLEQGQKYQTR